MNLQEHYKQGTHLDYIQSLSLRSLHRLLATFTGTHPNPLHTKSKFTESLPQLNDLCKNTFNKLTQTILKNLIQTQIKNYQTIPKEKNKEKSLTLSLLHSTSVLTQIPIAKILHQTYKLHFPNEPHPKSRIVYRNPPNLGLHFYNYKKEVKNLKTKNNFQPITTDCYCHLTKFDKYINEQGHVSTSDMTIIKTFSHEATNKIYELLTKGTTYIDTPSTSLKHIRKELNASLERFKKQCTKHIKQTKPNINTFIDDLRTQIDQQINEKIHNKNTTTPTLAQKSVQSLKHILQSLFIITPTDKLPKNFNFTCKKHWIENLYNSLSIYPKLETQNSKRNKPTDLTSTTTTATLPPTHPSFHRVPGDPLLNIPPPSHFHVPTVNPPPQAYKPTYCHPNQIIASHRNFLSKYKIPTYEALPTKALLFKQHKKGVRPLVTAFNTSTTNLSKILSKALIVILEQLKRHYPRSYTPINSSIDLSNHIQTINMTHNLKSNFIKSMDISGCYDNIDHSDLKYVINDIIPRTYQLSRYRYIKISSKDTTFTNQYEQPTRGTIYLSEKLLRKLLIWKMENTIIQYGNTTFRQMIGIGQGDNHSPQLCNLYLCFYEIQLFEYIRTTHPKHFQLLSLTRRNIDDTLFFTPLADQLTYLTTTQIGIYPQIYFKLTSNDLHPFEETKFLDFHIYLGTNEQRLTKHFMNLHTLTSTDIQNILQKLCLPLHKQNYKNIYTITRYLNQSTTTKKQIWYAQTFQKTDEFPPSLNPIRYTHYRTHLTKSTKKAIITS